MRNSNNCVLHPQHLQDLVCTYDTCQHKLICQECAKVHYDIHDEDYIYPFQKLIEMHKGNRFTELKKQLLAEKQTLEKALRDKLDSTGPSGRLEAKVKQCEEKIGEAIQDHIRNRARDVKAIIQQFEGNHFKSQLINPEKMIKKIVKELGSEVNLVDECRRDTRMKLRSLHEWVERGLDEIELFNYEIDIIIDTIERRKQQILKKFKDNFNVEDSAQPVHLNVTVNQITMDRNDSFEAKYTKMKKVGWQNQRLSVEIDKLNKRMIAKDKKADHYQKEVYDLLGRIKTLQFELDKQTKKYVQLQRSRQIEKMRQQQDQKDQRKQLQDLLLHKGVDMMGDVRQINLKNKGIIPEQLRLISRNFPDIILLDLSQNKMAESQLQAIFVFQKLRTLQLNYSRLSAVFIKRIAQELPKLTVLHLDSNSIDDQMLHDICSLKLTSLSLVDNRITDTGGQLIANRVETLRELYLSYNQLTFRSVENISKYLYELKTLHLARNKVRNRGALQIAKGLKELEQLFLGGCEISKQGCLPIARNNSKLKRLSLGKNELSTDSIFELIMYLSELQWLDISYSNLAEQDLDRIRKLCVANDKLQIVMQQS